MLSSTPKLDSHLFSANRFSPPGAKFNLLGCSSNPNKLDSRLIYDERTVIYWYMRLVNINSKRRIRANHLN